MIARAPLDLPPEVARAFVADMRAYFDEDDVFKRGEIAGRQLSVLKRYQPTRAKPLRLSDVEDMFRQMREHLRDE